MVVMQVTSHPAELCLTHESKYRVLTINWNEKIEAIAAKFGVKLVGSHMMTTPLVPCTSSTIRPAWTI